MISTHVLDTALGRPAAGVPILLERVDSGAAPRPLIEIARAATDADGRVRELLPDGRALEAGHYRLTFDTAAYFAALGTEGFYPVVTVSFTVRDPSQHHHVPLLLSAYGYATYRGS
jgi:5-hydroxyisourate hydrolase